MKQVKDKTLRDLALMCKWKDVLRSLRYHYNFHKHWDKYEPVFTRCQTAKKRRQSKPTERLEVYGVNTVWDYKGDEDRDGYYGIHILEEGSFDYEYEGKKYPKVWSMSFVAWDKLINMLVANSTLENYKLEDIAAHFIYEITWYGNEKNMKKVGKRLLGRVKDAKKQIKNGTLKTVSLDKVFKDAKAK